MSSEPKPSSSQVKRVLFVCMGNICRSPAAEGVFQYLINQMGLGHRVQIDSAGTIGYHAGKPADARMRRAASERGYELTSISRQVKAWDLDEFDLVVAMDRDNLENLRALKANATAEVCLLSDFLDAKWPRDVPDPYYGGDAGFQEVLDMIEAACPNIVSKLLPTG